MTAIDVEPQAPEDVADRRTNRLTLIRRIAIGAWLSGIVIWTLTSGLALNRELILLYVCTGLLAAGIGRRRVLLIVRDWLPFALVLIVYDLSRGAADLVGTPTTTVRANDALLDNPVPASTVGA